MQKLRVTPVFNACSSTCKGTARVNNRAATKFLSNSSARALLSPIVVKASTAAIAFLCSTFAYSAIPLNDLELTNNFLQNSVVPIVQNSNQVQSKSITVATTQQQLEAIDKSTKDNDAQKNESVSSDAITESFFPIFIHQTDTSNISTFLEKKDREVNFMINNTLFGIDILSAIAVNNFGSEFYSYLWEGNYKNMVDLSQLNKIYFDRTTGSYEVSNIRGVIEIETSFYTGNENNRQFRLSTRIF